MKRLFLVPLLLLLWMADLSGQQLVWPGDANSNGVVNNVDLLYIGAGFGTQGPARNTQGVAWQPAQASNWNQSIDSINYAHLDCNGDGFINNDDSLGILVNYDSTNLPITADSFMTANGSGPPLFLDLANDTISFSNDTIIPVDIHLGDSSFIADSVYSLAFSILFDSTIVDTIIDDFDGGFLNHTGAMRVVHYEKGRIEFGITRTNQTLTTGFGRIGGINIVMDDNLRISSTFVLELEIVDIVVFGVEAAQKQVQPAGTQLVGEVLTSRLRPQVNSGRLYPVPARDQLRWETPAPLVEITLVAATGQVALQRAIDHQSVVDIDVADLPVGEYILSGRTEVGILRKRLLIQR